MASQFSGVRPIAIERRKAIWRHTAGTIEYLAQCRYGDAQFFSKFTTADVIGFKVNTGDEFARMWRVVRAH